MVFNGLGACEGRLVGGAHRLTAFNAVGEANVMDKMGEGHPPPGVVMVRSGGATSALLLPPSLTQDLELHRRRHRDRRMHGCQDRTVERDAEFGRCGGWSNQEIPNHQIWLLEDERWRGHVEIRVTWMGKSPEESHGHIPSCHASGGEWMQRSAQVWADFPSPISALIRAVDFERGTIRRSDG